jgi:hypothetical protein
MQGLTTTYTAAELTTIGLAAILVILLAIIGYRAWQRSRVTADERERRRCAHLVEIGKINDARLVEIRENLVFTRMRCAEWGTPHRRIVAVAGRRLSIFGSQRSERDTTPEIRRTRSWRRRSGAYCAGPRASSRKPTPAIDIGDVILAAESFCGYPHTTACAAIADVSVPQDPLCLVLTGG